MPVQTVGPFILTASVQKNRENVVDCFLKVRKGEQELKGTSHREKASIFFFSQPNEETDSASIVYYGQQLKDVRVRSQIKQQHEIQWLLKACGSFDVYLFGRLHKCRGCPHMTHHHSDLCTFKLEQQLKNPQKTHTDCLREISEGKTSFYICAHQKEHKIYVKMTKNKTDASFSSKGSTDGKMLFTCQSI